MLLKDYDIEKFHDEMMDGSGNVRPWYKLFCDKISSLDHQDVLDRQYAAERAFMFMGVTFNVYKEGAGVEKIFPFDIIPRIINYDDGM